MRVRGGRREAQEKAQALENRWGREVEPHLVAAGVTDLDGLDAKIAEARELDAGIKAKDAELESLRAQIAALAGAAEALREASDRAAACRAALGDVGLDTLAADLKALGADAIAGLRKRRQQLSKEAEAARAIASQAANAQHTCRRAHPALAGWRWMRPSRRGMPRCRPSRREWMRHWSPHRAALAAGIAEKEKVAAEFASLERTIEERKNRIDAALSGARTNAAQATIAVETAQGQLTTAKTDHALQRRPTHRVAKTARRRESRGGRNQAP